MGHPGQLGFGGAVSLVGFGHGSCHPPEQVARTLDRCAGLVFQEVALLEDGDRIGRQPNRVPWGGRFHTTPRLEIWITKRVGATLLHHRTSQPKRKAKLGRRATRDNTTENPRIYVRSHFSHHKYSGGCRDVE